MRAQPEPQSTDRPSFRGSEIECLRFLFGTGTSVVEQRYAKTFGARLVVLDVPRGSDLRRCLVSIAPDGLVTQQSAMSLARPEKLVFDYEKVMALAVAALRHPKHVLLLGLGGGAMARFLAAYLPDTAVTIVERDPTVMKLAKRHFRITQPIVHDDAAAFVAATSERFDAILVDLYGSDGFSPPPLEFWDDCAVRLDAGGCLAINWADGRHKALYRPHVARAASHARTSFFLAPRGFKDNVVQFCSTDDRLGRTRLAERTEWLAKAERRKSILERCREYRDLP